MHTATRQTCFSKNNHTKEGFFFPLKKQYVLRITKEGNLIFPAVDRITFHVTFSIISHWVWKTGMQLNFLLSAIFSMHNGNVDFVNYFTALLKLRVSSREAVLWVFIMSCQPCGLFIVIIMSMDSHGCWYEQARLPGCSVLHTWEGTSIYPQLKGPGGGEYWAYMRNQHYLMSEPGEDGHSLYLLVPDPKRLETNWEKAEKLQFCGNSSLDKKHHCLHF